MNSNELSLKSYNCKKWKEKSQGLDRSMFNLSYVLDIFNPFSNLMMKILSYKYYDNWIRTHDNDNTKSNDHEES